MARWFFVAFVAAALLQEGQSFLSPLPLSSSKRLSTKNLKTSLLFSSAAAAAAPSPTPSTTLHPKLSKNDSLESFNDDITNVIKNLRSGPDETVSEMFRERAPHLSMAYLWTDDDWKRQMSRKRRYVRGIIYMYRSRLLKRILPQLSVCIIWSVVASLLMGHSKHLVKFFDFSITSLSLVSTFVAALLTLRSNQGLSRLGDARSAWGRLVSVSRDTSQVLSVYLYPENPELGLLAARHLSLFGWLLKCRLREADDSDIIDVMLPEPDASYVKGERKHAIASVHRIRQIAEYMAEQKKIPYSAQSRLEKNLWYLNRIFGRCERVKGSCIPPLYTAHVTRLLVFYLCFLPFALASAGIAVIPTTLITGTVAFAMMGLDEIGHILEQPFRLMPLQQQAANAMIDVADAFVGRPPPLFDDGSETNVQNSLKPSYW